MTDSLSALKLFTRVARTGSFTAAGREAGLSQPSVSRIVSNLEKDLGVLLFTRTTHAVRTTEAGEEYLARIEPILSDIDEANHFVRDTGEVRGQLRVGAATSFAQREIIPVLPDFLEMHPQLKLELALTDDRQDLVTDAIDVAVRFGTLQDSTIVARKLGETPRLIAASPSYLRRYGEPAKPADLVNHQIILGPSSIGKSGWSFKKDGKVQSVGVDGRLKITVNEGTTAAALAGMGIVSTALWGCKKEIKNGSLIRLLPDWSLGRVEVHALFSGGRKAKPAARAFADYLQGQLKSSS